MRCSSIPRSRAPARRSCKAYCLLQHLAQAVWRHDGAHAMADDTLLVAGSWAAAMLRSSTPLMMVTLGETLTQRVGIVNLGIEGQMLCGACIGFAVAAQTGSPTLGLAAGAIAGLLLSLVHGVLCLGCEANQIGSGIAVFTLGLGLPSYFGRCALGGKVVGWVWLAGVEFADVRFAG